MYGVTSEIQQKLKEKKIDSLLTYRLSLMVVKLLPVYYPETTYLSKP
jgi:hypothetical protein